jgi:hypothetical protein
MRTPHYRTSRALKIDAVGAVLLGEALSCHRHSDSYDPEFQNEYLKLFGKEAIMPDGIAHARPARRPIFQQSADWPTRAPSAASYSVEKWVWNSNDPRHLWIISNPDAAWHARCHWYLRKQRKMNDLMKIDMAFGQCFFSLELTCWDAQSLKV